MLEAPALMDLADAAGAAAAQVGGKASRLGLMRRLGLPVPDGFVITAQALAGTDVAGGLSSSVIHQLVAELEQRGWSGRPLAVRSSAVDEDAEAASFAGIYRSVLGVVGASAAVSAVVSVWSSLYTPQAVAYRNRMGLAGTPAAMAVIVMPMVSARAAGTAFTCDPRSGRDDWIVIESGHDGGEKIVVAEETVTEALTVISRTSPAEDGQGLDDVRALSLAALLREAAQSLDYAAPYFDFEWVWSGGEFVLVQARPITARAWNTYDGLRGQPCIWSNGNTRDFAPNVMGAMDWLEARHIHEAVNEVSYRLAGYPILPGSRHSALLNGRLYLNFSLLQWEAFDAFGVTPDKIVALLGGHHPKIKTPKAGFRQRLRRGTAVLRYLLQSPAERRRGRREIAAAFADAARLRRDDLKALCDRQLADRLETVRQTVRTRRAMMLLQVSPAGIQHLIELVERGLPGQGHSLAAALLGDGEISVTAQQAADLQAMAREAAADPEVVAWLRTRPKDMSGVPAASWFGTRFDAFLERYGHRGIWESYLRNPRFREEPGYLLDIIAGLMDARPDDRQAYRRQRIAQSWAKVRASLPFVLRSLLRPLVRSAIRLCGERELARSAFVAYGEVTRLTLLEVGARFTERGAFDHADDIFDLTLHEVAAGLRHASLGALRARVAHRRARMDRWERQPAPDVVIGNSAAAPPPPDVPSQDHDVMRGIPVGGGVAEGEARIVHDPRDGGRLGNGDILIAPSSDPAWTPLFLKAGGIVLETGGYLSHAATVAREFGIPTVVNIPGIVAFIHDGQRLRVDGMAGTVSVLDRP